MDDDNSEGPRYGPKIGTGKGVGTHGDEEATVVFAVLVIVSVALTTVTGGAFGAVQMYVVCDWLGVRV